MKISVVIPIYNQAEVLLETLECVYKQSYQDFEIIIGDDGSTDNLKEILRIKKFEKLHYFDFKENVGYCANLKRTLAKAKGDLIFLLGADDIISENFFERAITEFKNNKNCYAISRAYYWFTNDKYTAVRVKEGFHDSNAFNKINQSKSSNVSKGYLESREYYSNRVPQENESVIINLNSSPSKIIKLLSTTDQLSGLVFRNFKNIENLISNEVFTAHVELMVDALKKGDVHFISGFPLAVRIAYSQTRTQSRIYEKSPLLSWIGIVNNLLDKDPQKKNYLIKEWICKNSIGLLQIRCYGNFKWFLREALLMLKYRTKNIINFEFWSIVFLCIFIPRKFLGKFVDFVKYNINSLFYKKIKLTK